MCQLKKARDKYGRVHANEHELSYIDPAIETAFEAGARWAIKKAIKIIETGCDGDLDYAVFKLKALAKE